MARSSNDNHGSPLAFEAVVKQAILDWSRQKGGPVTLNDSVIGGLALLITYRLMRARLVTFERTSTSANESPTL